MSAVEAVLPGDDVPANPAAIEKLVAALDYMLGSVQAITEGGDLVVASGSASQLGPYASGAGRLILVGASQKIVRDIDEALRRIDE